MLDLLLLERQPLCTAFVGSFDMLVHSKLLPATHIADTEPSLAWGRGWFDNYPRILLLGAIPLWELVVLFAVWPARVLPIFLSLSIAESAPVNWLHSIFNQICIIVPLWHLYALLLTQCTSLSIPLGWGLGSLIINKALLPRGQCFHERLWLLL